MVRAAFHKLAERELNEAERCQRSIEQHPQAGTMVQGQVRRRLLHRLPYALLYAITPRRIRILAVMNLKRRPSYWVGRQ